MNQEITRRRAAQILFALSPAATAQQPAGEPQGRIAPLSELVNILEFESMAKTKLPADIFATIAGSDRKDLERSTFRPHLMVDTTKLDLTTDLLGERMFAPILIGPASNQSKIHPEGELATVQGASAANAVTIISSSSSNSLEKIMAEAKGPVWYQVEDPSRAQQAIKLGCKVLVITVKNPQKPDWQAIDRLRKAVPVPVVLKGILTSADAELAIKRGIQAIVVSSYGSPAAPSAFSMLPSIADAVSGRVPILIDGSFRRGTDILKALILGAHAVLVTRPPLWGLAAYGAPGVQAVMEMLQTELGRNMIMIGAPSRKALQRNMLKLHL